MRFTGNTPRVLSPERPACELGWRSSYDMVGELFLLPGGETMTVPDHGQCIMDCYHDAFDTPERVVFEPGSTLTIVRKGDIFTTCAVEYTPAAKPVAC